ncbi:MAG: 4-(cytidine 5'-diphospho)-2-C-methyl-D-erythritol kinase [Treponema sp.]|nr:4-(cytidine 5'-diphospho)-2-C-methyl-D-erythritol kinase [Treponema sp.]
MPQIDELTVFAPAKVNLSLFVKNRRRDGFHDIESVFLAVNFGDTLHFALSGQGSTVIEGISVPDNIILRAVSLFREKTGFNAGLKINVEKNVPIGGGLGGGSSNAGAALLALNKICGSPLKKDVLLDMAASLGSDVPFFIHEIPAALVTGRGEHIEPLNSLDLAKSSLVLVNPGFSSSTAEAFRLLDQHRRVHTEAQRKEGYGEEPHTETQRHRGLIKDISSVNSFGNDFLEVLDKKEGGVYKKIISQLEADGAQYACLSGAGSTCFGVFKDKKEANETANALKGKWPFVKECAPICR